MQVAVLAKVSRQPMGEGAHPVDLAEVAERLLYVCDIDCADCVVCRLQRCNAGGAAEIRQSLVDLRYAGHVGNY